MYDKTNIIIMSKLAIYDNNFGESDLYKNQYYRHDYIYRQNMWVRFFVLIGSIILIMFYILHMAAVNNEDFTALLSTGAYKSELFKMCVFIISTQVAYTVLGTVIYTAAYEKAQKRIDNYINLIDELDKRNAAISKKKEEIATERGDMDRYKYDRKLTDEEYRRRIAGKRDTERYPFKETEYDETNMSTKPLRGIRDVKGRTAGARLPSGLEGDDLDAMPPPSNAHLLKKKPAAKPSARKNTGDMLIYNRAEKGDKL